MASATLICAEEKRHALERVPARGIRRAAFHYLLVWAGGFAGASILVMLMASHFVSSLKVYEWSPEIGDYVYVAGYVHRERGEGWATSAYGRFGLSRDFVVAGSSVPTVLIWGDSFVEAHQVDDPQKVASQVTRTLSQQTCAGLAAVAVGRSFWSVADYYFNIPPYEKLTHPICHFIVLAQHGLMDLCPDEERFLSTPTYRFVRCPTADPQKNRMMGLLRKWRLQDAALVPWNAVRNLGRDLRHMQFLLHPRGSPEVAGQRASRVSLSGDEDPNLILSGWTYALDMLKSCSTAPLVLVFVPEVPTVEGHGICCEDPQAQWSARLAGLCREREIGYIDMTQTLVEDYRETGRLSRGFHNGVPGRGHLNARGHYLLSQRICDYLLEHFSDLR